ncbi:hypothetical protein [Aliiroseovarius crassostreae]|uniref:hypothetical protein n=1 Tax=Aliiroseovarius crassostreae TaxID=154981 RepID=UPI003C7CD822
MSALLVCLTLTVPPDRGMASGRDAPPQEVIIPPKPTRDDIPERNHQGRGNGILTLPTTSVTRLPDGQIAVMFGYITGSPNGRSSFYIWNTPLNLFCQGAVMKSETGSGEGEILCSHDGRLMMRDKMVIPAEVYMRFHGTLQHQNRDLDGNPVWTVLRWRAGRSFPDPAPLIEAFR